ncbi:RING finger domain protein [Aspergillus sclerotialis]|uniref:RING finger domain protein n=1 Tax=Aspergillus sclerotialis TaxID=2070753 RepID=A0A3A3A753_9EURO|nr:RING finger domain protein [Aspergillus sclerotialis]
MASLSTGAQSLTVAATLFPGSERAINTNRPVNESDAFHLVLGGTIQTLSTNNSPEQGPITGLLFVPDLYPNDPCNKIISPFVPQNVTRLRAISPFHYQGIGLAPWISTECTQAFLNSSRKAKLEALIFFQPSSTDTSKPPSPSDSIWSLGDDEAWKNQNQYPVYAIAGPAGATLMYRLSLYSGNSSDSSVRGSTTQNGYIRLLANIDLGNNAEGPSVWGFILAILGSILVLSIVMVICYQFVQRRRRFNPQPRIEAGQADLEHLGLNRIKVPREVLEQMPLYSYPDLSMLPNCPSNDDHAITIQPSNDNIISMTLSSEGSNHGVLRTSEEAYLPNASPPEDQNSQSSPTEHPHDPPAPTLSASSQSPAPNLPIQPMSEKARTPEVSSPSTSTLPGQSPSKFPEPATIAAASSSNDLPSPPPSLPPSLPLPPGPTAVPSFPPNAHRLSHSQTTCAICLDDFIPHSSTVRELPCGHIFHSCCIDKFLTQNSCLCPLCKKSVLPPGRYRTPVSNFMVQIDSMVRRGRG